MNIKVAIAEDIDDIRSGLCLIINSTSGYECNCICKNGKEAIEKIPAYQPDVVLMDINMPGINGVEAVRILKQKLPSTQFMMCTVYEEDEHVFDSLKAGATGYILKKTPPAKLLDAITEIHIGGSPMSSTIARKIMNSFSDNKVKQPIDDLTEREKEILHQLARGMQYKAIAASLSLSVETVRTHIRNIYEKLQVHTKTEAIKKAYRN
ncbi:MAG: response regulator transcription factor [Chitinophagaceae bacterium]|nr:response regulator transcription factor [Chitinophagaceae bacterium]